MSNYDRISLLHGLVFAASLIIPVFIGISILGTLASSFLAVGAFPISPSTSGMCALTLTIMVIASMFAVRKTRRDTGTVRSPDGLSAEDSRRRSGIHLFFPHHMFTEGALCPEFQSGIPSEAVVLVAKPVAYNPLGAAYVRLLLGKALWALTSSNARKITGSGRAVAVFAGGFTELSGITAETEILYTGTVLFWIKLAREKEALLTVHVTHVERPVFENMASWGMKTARLFGIPVVFPNPLRVLQALLRPTAKSRVSLVHTFPFDVSGDRVPSEIDFARRLLEVVRGDADLCRRTLGVVLRKPLVSLRNGSSVGQIPAEAREGPE